MESRRTQASTLADQPKEKDAYLQGRKLGRKLVPAALPGTERRPSSEGQGQVELNARE